MHRLIGLDWAIKKILREKANFDILEGFLSELLRFDVTIQEILESESNRERAEDKHNRVDLLAKDENGQLIIIEVQNESETDYLQRILFGTSKAVVEHLPKGAPYAHLKKAYSVSIVHFHLGDGDDYLYHGTTQFMGLHTKKPLELKPGQQQLFEVKTPSDLMPEYYLIKVPAFDNQIRSTIDEWIYFLKNEDTPENFKAKGLQAAKEKLDILKMDKEERLDYEAWLDNLHYRASMTIVPFEEGKLAGLEEGELIGREKGLEEGELIGREKGKLEEQFKVARRMLSKNLPIKDIADMTDLSIEQVQELEKEL